MLVSFFCSSILDIHRILQMCIGLSRGLVLNMICILRSTGDVAENESFHLNVYNTEGTPPELGREHLFHLSWEVKTRHKLKISFVLAIPAEFRLPLRPHYYAEDAAFWWTPSGLSHLTTHN